PDRLAAAELVVVVDGDDAVPELSQAIDDLRRHDVLDADVEPLHPAEARAVARRLRVLAVVGDAHHHLRVALRLHRAAHHAEAHHGLAVPGDEARDDRLVGALLRPDLVRMTLLQHKGRAAVLQRDAGARNDDPRAEAPEI